jgi:membrane AbrB-like protein
MLVSYLETLVVALVSGIIFNSFHFPMPWMLGPLMGILLWNNLLKRKTIWSIKLRNSGLIVLGYVMGGSFTVETAHEVIKQLPSMLISTSFIVIFGLILGYVMHRRTGISLETAILGTTPGGLTQIAVFVEEIPNADITVVTFMQTIRLLSSVFIVPFVVIHGLAKVSGQTTPSHIYKISDLLANGTSHLLLFIIVAFCRASCNTISGSSA